MLAKCFKAGSCLQRRVSESTQKSPHCCFPCLHRLESGIEPNPSPGSAFATVTPVPSINGAPVFALVADDIDHRTRGGNPNRNCIWRAILDGVCGQRVYKITCSDGNRVGAKHVIVSGGKSTAGKEIVR